jgi:hypothetical protein
MLGFSVKRSFGRALSTFHPSLVSLKGADALTRVKSSYLHTYHVTIFSTFGNRS